MICPAASMPERLGIRTSIRTTSGMSSVRLLHGLGAVGCLADELEVVLTLQDHLQTPAEQRVIVDDHHAQTLGRPASPFTATRSPQLSSRKLTRRVVGVRARSGGV